MASTSFQGDLPLQYCEDLYLNASASPLDGGAFSGFAFAGGYPPSLFGKTALSSTYEAPFAPFAVPQPYGSTGDSCSSLSSASEGYLPFEGSLFAGGLNDNSEPSIQTSFEQPSCSPGSATPDDITLPTELEYRLYELSQANRTAPTLPVEQPLPTSLSPCTAAEIASEGEDTTVDFAAGETYWAAVVSRDPRAVNTFWYGVTSTKIYCRPTCPSRRPMRVNIKYFTTCQQAEKAGYRPCKRCTPDEAFETSVVRQATCTFKAAAFIESRIKAGKKSPTLTQLAEAVGMSPFYLQRTFKKHYGLSPKAYANRLARDIGSSALASSAVLSAK